LFSVSRHSLLSQPARSSLRNPGTAIPVHLEDAFADLLDTYRYPVAVHCFQLKRFQD